MTQASLGALTPSSESPSPTPSVLTSPAWQWTARQTAAAVRAHHVSAREVALAVLARLHAVNPGLNAVIGHDDAWTLAQADGVDQRLAAGEALPLAGVPYTVKDNLWVQGRRITQGSMLFADFVAPADAWAVARMKALGAVIVGITNCSEFACKGVTNNLLHGQTRSPWNPALTPGGSSGGAVAALAAGIGALALVTDAGGSTRRPAAHCGLVGMKPTFGLIPCGPGFDEPNFGLSVIGQLARNVDDAAWMFELLQGFDGQDWGSQPVAVQPPTAQPLLRTARVGWSADFGCGFAVDAPVRAQLQSAVDRLRAEGWAIDDVGAEAFNWPEGTREYPLLKLQQAGLAALYGAALDEDASRIDPDLQAQIRAGRGFSGAEIAQVLLLRERLHLAVARFFEHHDLLLTPTTPVTSWPLDRLGPDVIGGLPAGPRGHAAFTPLVNYAQAPACSVPAGLVDGLPVGLQVIGPRYADTRVLQFAAEVERVLGQSSHPPLWYR
jgi:aspartyl-tRNA(Asn)/glutamyl-tRNA(Gln) amidotransferase subunit A